MKKYSACGLNFECNTELPYFSCLEKGNTVIKFVYQKKIKNIIPNNVEVLLKRKNLFIANKCFYYWNTKCEFLYLHDEKILYYNYNDKHIFYLFITGLLFKLLGYYYNFILLHASAFNYNNKNILCAGKVGSGKSTIVYNFLCDENIIFYCDDIVPVFVDYPTYFYSSFPFLKLWEADIKTNKENVIPVVKDLKKYYLNVSEKFLYSLNKLELILIIEVSYNDKIKFEEINGKDKFISIYNNIYKPAILGKLHSNLEFNIVTEIANKIITYKVYRPVNVSQEVFLKKLKNLINNNVI
ncbi:MAG: hypothetical protein N3A01_03625 [Bacteroidales bacterium]|nr:hypothetical protein [Bacteroidales bacterium]